VSDVDRKAKADLARVAAHKPYAVMVTGTRRKDLCLRDWVRACLDAAAPAFVVLGDCPTGVDALALEWCEENLTPDDYQVHRADWKAFGPAAGPKRNAAMVAHAAQLKIDWPPVFVLAFPRGGPGTRDCMAQARRAGLTVEEL
jgi:hypothetical protein